VIGDGGAIGGCTLMNDWFAPTLSGVKAHDFAISLGPIVVTADELDTMELEELVAHAASNTRLRPGDLLGGEGSIRDPVGAGDIVEFELEPFGVLRNTIAA
jgi:2-keto-4-pentenoate hydratase/2-oxohepta-3-ene-1,7-dioic acid hydratase in catechol pathway